MFYLINEKDGLFDNSILVNTFNLRGMEIGTGKDYFSLVFRQNEDTNKFLFKPDNIFNITKVMKNITEMIPSNYYNKFITLTDTQNINIVINRFGANSDIIAKVNHILINIEDIELAYKVDDHYVINTAKKKFVIDESPQEIFDMIAKKMIHQHTSHNATHNNTNVAPTLIDNKLEIKKRL